VVTRRTSGQAASSIAFINGNGAANGIGVAVRADATHVGFLRGSLAWQPSNVLDDGKVHVHTVGLYGTAWQHRIDGVATNLDQAALGVINTPGTASYVPTNISGHDYAGDICEILYYDRVLTIEEQTKVEQYLTAKWVPAGGQPKVYTAGAFAKKPLKVWTGSAWVVKPVKVWTGSAWKVLS
jgi:hypothetical protein